jgi:hypothetical protein
VVDTAGGPSVELALRALGYVDDVATAVLPSGGGSVALGPADLASGDYVVVARSGSSVVVRLVHVTQSATTTATTEPTTTTSAPTTTTTEASDDGRVGWPGTSVGGFDDPTTAAVTFADQVLGFAQTTVVSSGGENDLFVTLTSRPGAGAQTTIQVHDTGARGWIVVGASSNQGRIDTPTPGDQVASPVQVTGVATAFEAQLSVRLLSLSGEVRGQTTTFAGANGEQGPYDTTVAGSIDGPTFVLIGDADASGEGDLSWAAVVLVMV